MLQRDRNSELQRIYDMLFEKNSSCNLCGRADVSLALDHILPHSIFKGVTIEENFQLLCNSCNARKKNLCGESLDKRIEQYFFSINEGLIEKQKRLSFLYEFYCKVREQQSLVLQQIEKQKKNLT